jgi:FKBP-type peptidyl-prolyl cis-trans isomerase FkpA
MKKLLFLILFPLAVFAISSCGKSSDIETLATNQAQQAKDDDAAIKAYLTVHPEINNVKDTLGVYYQIITPGAGAYPTDETLINGTYSGSLLNGTAFATNAAIKQYLKNLIPGWRIALPKVAIGSKVLMIIPSGYAYGATGSGPIPPNAVLIFTVDLTIPGA